MYKHKQIEKKWQAYWEENKTFKVENDFSKPKYYCLDMFPYPSGEGLHVGHPEWPTANDIMARYKTAKGFNVLHPMWWDAFGLPAENFAIKTGTHPRITTDKNIANFKRQYKMFGFSYDWDREVDTTDPEYYKWTQWIFLKLFEKGLAYEQDLPINYCPSCKTGLANEEVLNDFSCERCGEKVEKKKIRQWVLAITKYADRLLTDIDKLDWPEGLKEMQRNWIGKNSGVKYKLKVKGMDLELETYSTHFEAFYADTFAVMAADLSILKDLVKWVENEKEILEFAKKINNQKVWGGYKEVTDHEWIFTGRYLLDPITKKEMPLWISSYALSDYGTGIIKCSAHDERDFNFAKKYDLPLRVVMFPENATEEELKDIKDFKYCFNDFNKSVLSLPEEFSWRKPLEAHNDIIKYLVNEWYAEESVQYKLRDWLFSRQRYWGEPIPLVHCDECGIVGEKEENLPILLPKTDNFEPSGDGTSPLTKIESFVNCECPKCWGAGKRETNTMPQWGGSCWYYLRYMNPNNKDMLVDPEVEKYWGQVDSYVGGAEHAVLHLLYARFWHKFLFDIGVVSNDEPFYRLRNQGLILAHAFQRKNGGLLANDLVEEKGWKFYEIENGEEVNQIVSKMSKSLKNVVNPDSVIDEYGADTLRLYEMYMAEFKDTAPWDTKWIVWVRRFLDKVDRAFNSEEWKIAEDDSEAIKLLNKTIKKVEEDIENYKFNTAIASMMILVNYGRPTDEERSLEWKQKLAIILSPFAPHMAEELWGNLWNKKSIFFAEWPKVDESMLVENTVKMAVQVMWKVRGTIEIAKDENKDSVLEKAKSEPNVAKWIEGKKIVKEIYVPGKIVNLVVK